MMINAYFKYVFIAATVCYVNLGDQQPILGWPGDKTYVSGQWVFPDLSL